MIRFVLLTLLQHVLSSHHLKPRDEISMNVSTLVERSFAFELLVELQQFFVLFLVILTEQKLSA